MQARKSEQDSDGETQSSASDRVFQVWSKSEDIAVHFNDLIMRWRLQAVGGLAAIATLAGFVVGDADTLRVRYRAMIMLSALLACGWVGVGALDLFYYRKLLQGAVQTILRLEEQMSDVHLSTDIEEAAKSGARWAPWLFYGLGLAPLLVFIVWASAQLCSTPPNELDKRRDAPAAIEDVLQPPSSSPATIALPPLHQQRIR